MPIEKTPEDDIQKETHAGADSSAAQQILGAQNAWKQAQADKEAAAAKEIIDAQNAWKQAQSAPPVIKHVWTSEDTYANLAFKYYGSIQEPYWRLIYDHNKDIIGSHPNAIRVGLEIEIPPLPEELKKK